MNFKKTILASLITAQALFGFSQGDIQTLNKIIENGIVVNKMVKTNQKDVNLIIYKGYVTEDSTYALLKLTNDSDAVVSVKEVVKEGVAVKNELEPSESTYIIVEEQKVFNSVKKVKKDITLEEKIKTGAYLDLVPVLEKMNGSFYITDSNDLKKIPTVKFTEHFKTIANFDYINYTKVNIQNSLYEGYYFNGYEELQNGQIFPRSYYFVVDGVTGELNYVYFMNKNIDFKEFKTVIAQVAANSKED